MTIALIALVVWLLCLFGFWCLMRAAAVPTPPFERKDEDGPK